MRPIFVVQLHRLMFDIKFKNSRTKSANLKSTCEMFHNKNTLLIRTDILIIILVGLCRSIVFIMGILRFAFDFILNEFADFCDSGY